MESRNKPNTQHRQAWRPPAWSQKRGAYSKVFFPSDTVGAVALATKTFERERKLEPVEFTAALAFFKGDTIAYPDIASGLHVRSGIDVTPQAVAQKVQKSEGMFQSLVRIALQRAKVLPTADALEIPGIGDVLLADASTIALRNSLAAVAPGTGGDGPKAALKLHALFNLSRGQLPYLALTDGKASDQTTKGEHVAASKPGDVIIRDLGYFEVADLEDLAHGGRFFVTRIPLSLKKFRTPDVEDLLDIWEALASFKGTEVDRFLAIGDERFLTRMLALRLPRKKWRARLVEMRKEKGRTLTRREEAQAKWNLLATNITHEQASAATIQKLYSLRWQLELLWKACKSGLGIDRLKAASCAAVVRAFVWARLLCVVLMLAVRGLIAKEAPREIGLIRWFRRVAAHLDSIRELIFAGRWLALARLLRTLALRYCLSEKHSKLSSREKVRQSAALDRLRPARSMP